MCRVEGQKTMPLRLTIYHPVKCVWKIEKAGKSRNSYKHEGLGCKREGMMTTFAKVYHLEPTLIKA